MNWTHSGADLTLRLKRLLPVLIACSVCAPVAAESLSPLQIVDADVNNDPSGPTLAYAVKNQDTRRVDGLLIEQPCIDETGRQVSMFIDAIADWREHPKVSSPERSGVLVAKDLPAGLPGRSTIVIDVRAIAPGLICHGRPTLLATYF